MPSGGFLPSVSQSPSFLGTYSGNFPNPIQKLSTPNIVFNSYSFQHFADPQANAPGDIGLVGFYQTQPGPFQYNGVSSLSFWQMEQDWKSFQTEYNSYNSAKATYVALKDIWNTAYMFNQFQKQDFFRSFLEPKKVVPQRPCKPTLPVQFKGLTLKIEPTWFTSFTADQKNLFWAAL